MEAAPHCGDRDKKRWKETWLLASLLQLLLANLPVLLLHPLAGVRIHLFVRLTKQTEDQQLSRNPLGFWHQIGTIETDIQSYELSDPWTLSLQNETALDGLPRLQHVSQVNKLTFNIYKLIVCSVSLGDPEKIRQENEIY